MENSKRKDDNIELNISNADEVDIYKVSANDFKSMLKDGTYFVIRSYFPKP